jgi:hypothetical protein
VLLVARFGYVVRDYRITADGRCPDCAAGIPGLWHPGGAADVPRGNSFNRVPRRVELN